MKLEKMGKGRARGFADMAKVSISLVTRLKNKPGLLDAYLLDYDVLCGSLRGFLEKHQVELSFENYRMAEKVKTVDETINGKTQKRNEIEYYYICGNFSLELPIINNDRLIVAELIDCIEKINEKIDMVSYHINFTLSEEKASKLRAEATNNALDNIRIEVEQVAEHLGLHNISLQDIDFTDNSNMYTMRQRSDLSPAERVQKLDEMLESKEITVESSFVSAWEIF